MAVLTTRPMPPSATQLTQPSLFALGEPAIDATFATLRRTWLDRESWVDHAPGWLCGGDAVHTQLVAGLLWRQRTVTMYDRRLAEPRLTARWPGGDGDPTAVDELLEHARSALSVRYERPFDTVGCNLYRDGSDSVAWHSDRERFAQENPVVAIISTGSPRAFRMRPIAGASDSVIDQHLAAASSPPTARGRGSSSVHWSLGDGDLFVMGGACQHNWQHCVPKTSRHVGPRLSIMFRHHLAGLPGWD